MPHYPEPPRLGYAHDRTMGLLKARLDVTSLAESAVKNATRQLGELGGAADLS
jgi:hypothetical protein